VAGGAGGFAPVDLADAGLAKAGFFRGV